MFRFSQVPLLRLLIPITLGVIYGRYFGAWVSSAFHWLNISLVAILLIALIYLRLKQRKSFSKRWLFGALSSFFLFFIGIIYQQQHNHEPQYSVENKSIPWIGQLHSIEVKSNGAAHYQVELKHIQTSAGWERVNFSILLYASQHKKELQIGDIIAGKSYLNKIALPLNPTEFDYASFCANRNIYYQAVEQNIQRVKHQKTLRYYARNCRNLVLNWFFEMGIDGDELAVLSALTLGDKSALSPNLKSDYAAAGAMHILAVSGLHVGIIYLLFSQLFKRFDQKAWQRFLKGLLLLLIIWSYALLTGFSPSVQRASCMFSFIIISTALKRHSNIINSLAGSALLLILINPTIIFEVGFQLSYAAVVGIVLIHPVLYQLISSKFWLLDKVWGLVCVSFAAQLATLPFTVYYFHQFPNWFLLVNLFVIPLAFAIVLGAIVVATLWGLFHKDFYLGKALDFILESLNYLINITQSLPFSVTENIWLSKVSIALFFISVVLLVAFILEKKVKLMQLSISLLGIILFIELGLDAVQVEKKFIGFYAYENSPIAFVNGLKAEVFVQDSSFQYYQKRTINNHLNREGVRDIKWFSHDESSTNSDLFKHASNSHITLVAGLNQNILILKEGALPDNLSIANCLYILNKEAMINEEEWFNQSSANFIFPSSIKSWSSKHQKIAEKYAVRMMSEQGYFQLSK
ncbi:MAG: ComEC/Rec2 family competence protein [Vicingaceae bacterium]